MATVESDAVPFDIPEEETEEKKTEKPEPEPESKPKSKTKEEPKYKSKKKDFFSDSSDDSDSDDDGFFRRASKNSGQNILIHKGRNIHIGNSYNFTQVRTAVSNINIKKNKNPPSESAPQFTESTKRKLPDEIKDSVREIDPEAMHFVAEHIASDWKKLARYLPPKGKVFSEGKLKTFEDDNPRNQDEAIYQMLNAWKEKYPNEATIGNLAETLNTIRKYEIAIKLKP